MKGKLQEADSESVILMIPESKIILVIQFGKRCHIKEISSSPSRQL